MKTQKERDVAEYLEKHKIMEMLENMISQLFYHRPVNPREFLIEQLRKSQSEEENLFNHSNLQAVFSILDPAQTNYITFAQYKQALITLGIKNMNECPEGVNEDRISRETFLTEATQGLQRSTATFTQPSPLDS